MEPQIVKIGSREFLQIENGMIPVDSIEQIGFNPEAIVNEEHTPRLQIDYGDGYKFAATGENAVKVWKFLAKPGITAEMLDQYTKALRKQGYDPE